MWRGPGPATARIQEARVALADTTMDASSRHLKQVTLEEASEDAERMFTTLMGDKVEPRKLFIQEHARTVRNLDL